MPKLHRPQRLMALLAVAGIAAGGFLAMPGSARADGDTWHDGGCSQGEGQTIVIDWNDPLDSSGASNNIIRCILLEPDAKQYPVDPDNKVGAPLASAGLTFDPATGVITTIEQVTADSGHYWFYVVGEVGNWTAEWLPEPLVDTFLGVSLGTLSAPRNPIPVPAFDMPAVPFPTPTPSPTPSPSPSKTPTKEAPGASATPSASPTPSASRTPTQTATSTPTFTPTMSPTAKASATPTPSRTRRPTTRPPRATYRPQRPTYRPQPPVNPPPPPVQAPPPPPPPPPIPEEPVSAPPGDTPGQATGAANPTPSRVWGREDVTRQSAESDRSDKPAPWSQMAAVAGAVVIVGGLGTAFARGLQTSIPPVVEEE